MFLGNPTVKHIDYRKTLLMGALALLALLEDGCSSVRSRTELEPQDWMVYPGVRRDISDLGAAFEGKLKGPSWTPAMVVPILVADLPFSTALDTVALPYDIYQVQRQPETP
ncbi:hypothetical protein JCM19379_24380 [Methyloparacoccus murrellii]|jgi:uncharacterized protein YceK